MPKAPLLTRFAVPVEREVTLSRDVPTAQDEFPAVLERQGEIVRAGKTRLTEVGRETTDDR